MSSILACPMPAGSALDAARSLKTPHSFKLTEQEFVVIQESTCLLHTKDAVHQVASFDECNGTSLFICPHGLGTHHVLAGCQEEARLGALWQHSHKAGCGGLYLYIGDGGILLTRSSKGNETSDKAFDVEVADLLLLSCGDDTLLHETATEQEVRVTDAAIVKVEALLRAAKADNKLKHVGKLLAVPIVVTKPITDISKARATVEFALRHSKLGTVLWKLDTSDLGSIVMHVLVRDVADLHALVEKVLCGTVDEAMRAFNGEFIGAAIGKSTFIRIFENDMMALTKLTEHQQKVVDEVGPIKEGMTVHLRAPAGAGKTFVGLHWALQELARDPHSKIMLIASHAALCFSFASFFYQHQDHAGADSSMRVLLWCKEFGSKIKVARRTRARWELDEVACPESVSLLVVDEAHHLFGGKLPPIADDLLSKVSKARVLLSDVSQGKDAKAEFPACSKLVELTEVIRNSRRILAAASAFQLGSRGTPAKCYHDSWGPPLKSFIFDAADGSQQPAKYGEQAFAALCFVQVQFPGLSLDNRIIVACPTAEFAKALTPELQRRMKRFTLCDAKTAAAFLSSDDESAPAVERVVVDSISNIDGMERLVVICVGCDAPIDGDAPARSQLYRGITRAHLMAVVVNHVVPGGWLEFLRFVKLRSETATLLTWFEKLQDDYRRKLKAARESSQWQAKERHHMSIVDKECAAGCVMERPYGIFLAGGPGSGKGHIAQKLKEMGLLGEGYVHIDVDKGRLFLCEWQADPSFPKKVETSEKTQFEAGYIAKLIAVRCAQTGLPFVYDATLKNPKTAAAFMGFLRDISPKKALRLCIVFVDTKVEICQRRAESRAHLTGRQVAPRVVEELNAKARDSANKLGPDHELVDVFVRIGNSRPGRGLLFLGNDGAADKEGLRRLTSRDRPGAERIEHVGAHFGQADKIVQDVASRKQARDKPQEGTKESRPETGEVVQEGGPKGSARKGGRRTTEKEEKKKQSAEESQEQVVEQSIWDTAGNSAVEQRSKCEFHPFRKQTPLPWTRVCHSEADSAMNWFFSFEDLLEMATRANQVRIHEKGNPSKFVCSKPDAYPIENVRAGKALSSQSRAQDAADVEKAWSGSDRQMLRHLTQDGGGGGSLRDKVYHACGNHGGLHWQLHNGRRGFSGWEYPPGPRVELELLLGHSDAPAFSANDAVSKVFIKAGWWIDELSFKYSSGTVSTWTGSGGGGSDVFDLENDEHIIAVTGWVKGRRLYSIELLTDKDRRSKHFGLGEYGGGDADPSKIEGKGYTRYHHNADSGQEIYDIKLSYIAGWETMRLDEVKTRTI